MEIISMKNASQVNLKPTTFASIFAVHGASHLKFDYPPGVNQ